MKSETKILIVNDEPDMLDQMKRWLSFKTSSIDCVQTGDEGVQMASKNKYDYIFLDYHLKKDKEGQKTASAFIPFLRQLYRPESLIVVSATARQLSADILGVKNVLLVDSSFWGRILALIG